MTHLGYQYLGSISGIEVEQGFLDRLEMCWIECQILQQSMFSNRFIQIFENSLRIRAYISSISLRRLSIINRGLKRYSLLQYSQAKKKRKKFAIQSHLRKSVSFVVLISPELSLAARTYRDVVKRSRVFYSVEPASTKILQSLFLTLSL